MILPFILIIFSYATAELPFQSGYRYYEEIQGWLKLHMMPTKWDFALSRCLSEGALLASPTSEEMLSAMKTAIAVTPWAEMCGILTGIHATYTEDDYYTVDGISLQDLPVNGKISNKIDKPCNVKVQKYLLLLSDGSIGHANENDSHPYLCHKKEITNNGTACNLRDNEYTFDIRTGSCYKFHAVGQTWYDAANTCAKEGGGLAIINNLLEARVLNDLFLKYPPNVIVSDFQNTAMIGFLNWKGKGTWTTIHGQPLGFDGTMYADWLQGQPDGAKNPVDDTPQQCGGIIRATNQPFSLLDDVWCDKVKMAFICEISLVHKRAMQGVLLQNSMPSGPLDSPDR